MQAPKQNRTPQIPQGSHIAIPYSITYLGTQKQEWKGDIKYYSKVSITFEFPDLTSEFEGVTKPKVLSATYTHSMGSKGNLRPIVEGIVGGFKDDNDALAFDLNEIIGKPCLVQVEINDEWSNIKSAMILPKSIPAPQQFNENYIFDWSDNWDQNQYLKFPKFIQDKINAAPEYASRLGLEQGSTPIQMDEFIPEDISFM